MRKTTQGNIMLLITSLIWGSAFVAQSAGMDYVGPFTYNMSRNFIGFIVLIPIILIFRHTSDYEQSLSVKERHDRTKRSVIGGIFCGIVLAIASNFQQVGISMTTAGKAGFITALYIIIVPILSVFILKKKLPKIIWLCIFIAITGFYLLCIKEGFQITLGDFLCFICAICFSIHIIVIDYFTNQNTNGIIISCVQFFVAGIISFVIMCFTETPTLQSIWDAKITILYAGALSCGIAYTLQILGQRRTSPTVATLLMSLESVFAALFGWIILREALNTKELIGCGLIFLAVILAQLPFNLSHSKTE
ncbi:DMT family transporter [Eubacterium oxidoreducens]|uniref:Permease of the drug/metabolite transporter (DMT) superfamily n=1 Tax=Eubacterium oxidoreducens TaxID=1732 RepID=A0A1G6B5P5_EUBOX|nr:DMT family transporter [Eubacterium oxidoreducens]SDB15889.1 Permease of the drug/metabolite transporter (DMT) superfamily [Eubacterium oxidoreducens]